MENNNWLKSLPNCFGLEVVGDAMAPGILEGDILYVDRQQKPKGNAQEIAVLKIDEEYHVCKFTKYGNQYLLIHDNAPISTVAAARVEVVGKVVGGDIVTVNEENHSAGTKQFSA